MTTIIHRPLCQLDQAQPTPVAALITQTPNLSISPQCPIHHQAVHMPTPFQHRIPRDIIPTTNKPTITLSVPNLNVQLHLHRIYLWATQPRASFNVCTAYSDGLRRHLCPPLPHRDQTPTPHLRCVPTVALHAQTSIPTP
jgi:hypothetical protein